MGKYKRDPIMMNLDSNGDVIIIGGGITGVGIFREDTLHETVKNG